MAGKTVRDTVREKYGLAALRVVAGEGNACCGGAEDPCCGEAAADPCCGEGAEDPCCDPITTNLYGEGETATLPEKAVLASLGCGNPTALAELREGETVLENPEIEPTRIYQVEAARAFLEGAGLDVDRIAPQVEGRFMSAFVRAHKPG